MIVGVTGASGFIGRQTVQLLKESGHDVRKFVRREVKNDDEIYWSPAKKEIDIEKFLENDHPGMKTRNYEKQAIKPPKVRTEKGKRSMLYVAAKLFSEHAWDLRCLPSGVFKASLAARLWGPGGA